ncbi:aldehyde dehydrogenase family protein [Thermogymnomonas acidicola]|uniref:aldehyde dehydrogenase family protein n=1 Tax=Thermogymnomonas acidicola TaxID=399579 RepID=UPI00139682EC|nr:aldehyde dehydrogenase family protein [Thermogymnomonas acidicola]
MEIPLDEDTDIGPMITEGEARRVEEWVMEAEKMGAQALTGGRREGGAIYMPTVLVDVPREARVWRDEVFGPVTVVERFRDADEAVGLANSVPYGLQAGVFTSDLGTAMRLVERLEYGAVLINDTSDFRVDTMPFGGMKMSGIGREGVRFAVEEMTEIKLAIFRK